MEIALKYSYYCTKCRPMACIRRNWRSSPSSFFNCYLTNLKFALCSVPSFNLILSWRQVPAQALLVFHT